MKAAYEYSSEGVCHFYSTSILEVSSCYLDSHAKKNNAKSGEPLPRLLSIPVLRKYLPGK